MFPDFTKYGLIFTCEGMIGWMEGRGQVRMLVLHSPGVLFACSAWSIRAKGEVVARIQVSGWHTGLKAGFIVNSNLERAR